MTIFMLQCGQLKVKGSCTFGKPGLADGPVLSFPFGTFGAAYTATLIGARTRTMSNVSKVFKNLFSFIKSKPKLYSFSICGTALPVLRASADCAMLGLKLDNRLQ